MFHNLSGYDLHFIIKEIASDDILQGRTQIIAQNSERYISFTKYVSGTRLSFRFIDAFRFMPQSLATLSSYLQDFYILDEEFSKDGYADTTLLKQKGIFPYEYISNLEKLQEDHLPQQVDFYSSLTNSHISDNEYEHGLKVWNKYNNGGTLGTYSDLYLKTDVLLLACIFENFRTTCTAAYGLDPAHYYTSPGLSWDAMLQCTGVKLELLTDIDMVLFIEKGEYLHNLICYYCFLTIYHHFQESVEV